MRYGIYKPQYLEDVIGQKNTIDILSKICMNNTSNIPHAILLSGIHGIGKTLLARLFAKKINCFNQCNNCSGCNTAPREIDAATYNGVDDIREILEDVSYMPIDIKYKVYIFDEVHMLSRSAFDALLYTLQDPPEYAIFLFTTTRIDKLPETFLSRCLHLPLNVITKHIMKNYLITILNKENEILDNEIIDLMIAKSEGSLRQLLSILDYIMLLTDKSLNNIVDALKMIKYSDVLDMFKYILDGKLSHVINLQESYINKGCDMKFFFINLTEILKDILLTILGINNKMEHIILNYNISTNLIIGWWEITIRHYESYRNGLYNASEMTILLFSLLEDTSLKDYTKKQLNIK